MEDGSGQRARHHIADSYCASDSCLGSEFSLLDVAHLKGSTSGRNVGEDLVEIGGAGCDRDCVGMADGEFRLTDGAVNQGGHRVCERVLAAFGRHRLESDQRFVGTALLCVRKGEHQQWLEEATANCLDLDERPFRHRGRNIRIAAMHGCASDSHQWSRAVLRGVGQRQQFFSSALPSGVATQADLGPQQWCHRLHQTELVVDLLEARSRLVSQVGCFFELALPEPQVGEERVHHAGGPDVPAQLGFLADDVSKRFGVVEVALKELDECK